MVNKKYIASSIALVGLTLSNAIAGLPIFAGSTYDSGSQTGVIAMSGQLGGPWINERGIAVGNGSAAPAAGWAVVRWGPSLPSERLGSLGTNAQGNEFPKAFAINDSGIVVGSANRYSDAHNSLGTRAVRWDAGSMLATELLAGGDPNQFQSGTASGIDALGNAAGSVGTTAGFPMRWPAGTSTGEYLATLGSPTTGQGTGTPRYVAANGVIVGSASRYENGMYVGTAWTRWDASGVPTRLNTPPVVGNLVLRGASDIGAVIGTNGSESIFAAADGVDFITLKHLAPGTSGGPIVTKISATNVIVGTSTQVTAGGLSYIAPAVWPTPTSDPIELQIPRPPGSTTRMMMTGVNASGHSVGTASYFGPTSSYIVPFLWNVDGTGVELQSLIDEPGWSLQSVNDLSDTGWVVGEALYDPDDIGPVAAYRRFYSLLIPEAGTYGQGDANFDTAVDFDDLLLLAQHYGSASNGRVDVADLDLDGITDFDDLLTLAQNYENAAGFAADWALAQSIVPEPTVALGVLPLLIRPRRRD